MKTHLQKCLIRTWLTGFTLIATSLIASATVFVKDSFPIATGAYSDGERLYGTDPQHEEIIGFSGNWTSIDNTGVLNAHESGLDYPANIFLSASSGSLAINNGATGHPTGRVISRTVTGLPTTDTLYFSVLMKADETALKMLAAEQTYGIGLGKTGKPNNNISAALPTASILASGKTLPGSTAHSPTSPSFSGSMA